MTLALKFLQGSLKHETVGFPLWAGNGRCVVKERGCVHSMNAVSAQKGG